MPSNLGCIGLLAPDGSDLDQGGFVDLLSRLVPRSQPLGVAPDGVRLRRWTDPSGARVSLELNERGQVLGATPSFAGAPGVHLADPRMVNRDMTIAAVVDGDGQQLSALALELEERHFLPSLVRADDAAARPGDRRTPFRASVVALGLDMHAFPDDAAYTSSGLDRFGDETAGSRAGPGWAPDAFLSYGIWGDPETAEAHARVSGPVLALSERVNTLTGFRFTVARLSTAGFEVDVCLPPSWSGSLQPGGLLVGEVFLVGSIGDLVAAHAVSRSGFWHGIASDA